MIDNYDSFTYNLVQYFEEIFSARDVANHVSTSLVKVYRNNDITIEQINHLNPNYIVISPGPCSPNEAGISLDIIKQFAGKIPILGVCLGHQCIGQVFSAHIIRAKKVMHGKTSVIHHQQQGIFINLTHSFTATRYHSLVIEQQSLPTCFDITAWTENPDGTLDEIMGIQHKTLNLHGVQFHPESILTEQGHALLANFLNLRFA